MRISYSRVPFVIVETGLTGMYQLRSAHGREKR
jgi:hypothetical protein